jgi:hypothetical protein
MVTPPDPHACSYNRIADEYCPSCVLIEKRNSCCDHPIIGLPKGHPNNHYSGCADQNPLAVYPTWTPFCIHPGCEKESSGASINGAEVCLEHIDWAMGKAFAPIRQLEDILMDIDKQNPNFNRDHVVRSAPVEVCADCGADAETIWNKEGTTIKLCYGCAYGRAGWE